MTIHNRLLFILAVFILWTFSCTKPVNIGSDFLDDQKASVGFKDTFDLTFFTEKTDSVIVHSDNVSKQLITYLCGNVQDPIFGNYSAEIFAQPLLPTVGTQLADATLDSVVLHLKYDTLGSYGLQNTAVTLEVYRMMENPDFKDDVYSNKSFAINPDMLGYATFVPRPKDSLVVDTVKFAPQIRIPLDTAEFSYLLKQNDTIFENQDSFLFYFNGLNIKMQNGGNAMIGFNLLNAVSNLDFYYHIDTLSGLSFRFVFTSGSVKTVHMVHDYTGSMVEQALTPDPETDLWYVQGLSGVTTSMKLEGLDELANVIINEADLDVYCTFPDGDNEGIFPPCPFIVTQEKTDTSIINSIDVAIALALTSSNNTTESYKILFGGKLGTRDPGPPVVYKYTMKVTNQLKAIIEGNKENIIYFNPIGKGNIPNRAVMFGPNHPLYAPRLKVYYTTI